MESRCPTPCGRTGPGLPPLLGRGSGSPWWPSAWPAPGCPHCPLLVGWSVLPPQAAPSPVPLGAGRGAGLVPSPAPASLLFSPAPRPSLLRPRAQAPSPPVVALSHAQTHISLYLAFLQISQKQNKTKQNPPSRSPCLSPLVPQAGLHVELSTSSLGVRLLVSSPRLPTPLHPPASCPSQGASRVPARCSSGPPAAKAPMLKSGPPLLRPPPFLPLLAHSRSPESRSSCLADRNLCRRGAWGWRARDRQQTGSTSRGVGGDKHWRTQLRGGAGREHGKRRHSGAALTGQATTEGSPPWRRVLGSPVLHLPQQPPAGVPHSAQKTGEPLHWRAGQRKPAHNTVFI